MRKYKPSAATLPAMCLLLLSIVSAISFTPPVKALPPGIANPQKSQCGTEYDYAPSGPVTSPVTFYTSHNSNIFFGVPCTSSSLDPVKGNLVVLEFSAVSNEAGLSQAPWLAYTVTSNRGQWSDAISRYSIGSNSMNILDTVTNEIWYHIANSSGLDNATVVLALLGGTHLLFLDYEEFVFDIGSSLTGVNVNSGTNSFVCADCSTTTSTPLLFSSSPELTIGSFAWFGQLAQPLVYATNSPLGCSGDQFGNSNCQNPLGFMPACCGHNPNTGGRGIFFGSFVTDATSSLNANYTMMAADSSNCSNYFSSCGSGVNYIEDMASFGGILQLVIAVAPCTPFELQCWLYPMFVFGLYLVLVTGSARVLKVPGGDMVGHLLEALTLASLVCVIFGILDIVPALIFSVAQVLRTVRA